MTVPFTPDQLAAMATMMATAFQQVGLVPGQPLQVQAPIVQGPANQQSPKTETAKPRFYSGGSDYQDFKNECLIFFFFNLFVLRVIPQITGKVRTPFDHSSPGGSIHAAGKY